ncbi:2-dehydropantoate 2-reductase [Psittacicella melopsittaci]|uniref:2-dehydropantoate 2-reductase n=1 Tax=Psittacicella melopsittaci TaxID=2028576 RepID=A0A3A1Y774_9GAMM|nr:2-dehydropantoate 2-reductase [Psittacicella melopsittaci]RIY31977.1 2-dehydropantoate 2-reductase [Psittacicella melopsittaci]
MKIAIAGAGAMGCSYGHMLKQAGNDVVLLDNWEDHVNKINESGLKVNEVGQEKVTYIKAYKPSDYHEKVDLVIVFTKSLQLNSFLQQIKHLLTEDTKVLCLLNGLGHIETLSQYTHKENIYMGVTVVTARFTNVNEPANVSFSSYGKTEIENVVSSKEAERFGKLIAQTINDSGLPCEFVDNIYWSIWRKACLNGCMNSLCTILDSNMLDLGKINNIEYIINSVIKEFAAIASTEGISLDIDEMTKFVMSFTAETFSGAKHFPSMHQDLIRNHRLTEVDYLNGYVSRRGKELNIPTPFNDLITVLVHGKEYLLQAK